MHKLLLTFDTEDFISPNSIPTLQRVLENLKKHELSAIFFITGHVAERLQNFPDTVDLLNRHIISYHSSSHSVHPTIFEFTDVASYKKAYHISFQREISHINPLTGEIEGKGGIYAIKDTFPKKQILAFRAPGHCWTPPHLEALRDLGIKYDFSADISKVTVTYKGVTFYPRPIMGHWEGKLSEYRVLSIAVTRRKISVISIHPSLYANSTEWDSIYWKCNPKELTSPSERSSKETDQLVRKLDKLFKCLRTLQKIGAIELTTNLEESKKTLIPTKAIVEDCYEKSMKWAKKHGYEPRFLHQHFLKFFAIDSIHDALDN